MDAKSAISLSSRSTRPLSDLPLMQYWACPMPCPDEDGPPHQLDDAGSEGLRCAVAIRSRFSGLELMMFSRHGELARGGAVPTEFQRESGRTMRAVIRDLLQRPATRKPSSKLPLVSPHDYRGSGTRLRRCFRRTLEMKSITTSAFAQGRPDTHHSPPRPC